MSGAWPVAAAVVLLAAGIPLALATGYLALLAALSVPPRPPVAPPATRRFVVLVPAHDEAAGIAATVVSLRGLDYPSHLVRVVVVADNCSDDTADRARAAGAEVLERVDPALRGKGYALAFGFAAVLAGKDVDAIVVVDADSVVSPGLLHAFAARLDRGARAVQAHYGVRNPTASWRTRLMHIALSAFHQVRSIGRERLGVSAGLRGNGMCFEARLLEEVPHDAFSLVEDLEYGVRLGLAGVRVAYAWEADVKGEMVSGGAASRSQRRRWEHGRDTLRRALVPVVVRRLVSRPSLLVLDLAADLLVPPLARLALGALAGLGLSVAVLGAGGPAAPAAVYAGALAALVVHVLAGWAHSGTGVRGLFDLAAAPAYMAWKVLVAVQGAGGKPRQWVRTRRENETDERQRSPPG